MSEINLHDKEIVARAQEGLSHDIALQIVNGVASGVAAVAAARLADAVASRAGAITKPKGLRRKKSDR